jgi:hypothetical protein
MEFPKHTRRLLAATIAAAFLWAWLADPGVSAAPRLRATVGPGYISLKRADGSLIRTLEAGTYAVVVRDRTARGNFHLIGFHAGRTSLIVDRKTGIRYSGSVVWTVRFRRGSYHYLSDGPPGITRQFRVV